MFGFVALVHQLCAGFVRMVGELLCGVVHVCGMDVKREGVGGLSFYTNGIGGDARCCGGFKWGGFWKVDFNEGGYLASFMEAGFFSTPISAILLQVRSLLLDPICAILSPSPPLLTAQIGGHGTGSQLKLNDFKHMIGPPMSKGGHSFWVKDRRWGHLDANNSNPAGPFMLRKVRRLLGFCPLGIPGCPGVLPTDEDDSFPADEHDEEEEPSFWSRRRRIASTLARRDRLAGARSHWINHVPRCRGHSPPRQLRKRSMIIKRRRPPGIGENEDCLSFPGRQPKTKCAHHFSYSGYHNAV